MKNLLILLSIISIFSACTPPEKQSETEEGFIPSSWISSRVAAADERLNADPAGAKVWESIQAHGGLDTWFSNGPIEFRFDYQPIGGGTRRNSIQTIDQWSSRALHIWPEDTSISFGWDGTNAWIKPDTAAIGINPRFWSLTPFYFLGLPFVLADDGINYEYLGEQLLDDNKCDLVKITYQAGTGDAPDDFYIIYIDQQTKLMTGLRYVVSYPGFFPNGGHTNEKIMKLTGLKATSGVKLATGYQTFWWTGEVGEHNTNIDVLDVSFNNDLSADFFNIPVGAKIQEGF